MSDTDYPRQLYHPDGRSERVETKAQEDGRTQTGWSRQAGGKRYKPSGFNVATANDPLATLIRDVLESVLDERGLGLSRAERAEVSKPIALPFGRRGGERPSERGSAPSGGETIREDRKR